MVFKQSRRQAFPRQLNIQGLNRWYVFGFTPNKRLHAYLGSRTLVCQKIIAMQYYNLLSQQNGITNAKEFKEKIDTYTKILVNSAFSSNLTYFSMAGMCLQQQCASLSCKCTLGARAHTLLLQLSSTNQHHPAESGASQGGCRRVRG